MHYRRRSSLYETSSHYRLSAFYMFLLEKAGLTDFPRQAVERCADVGLIGLMRALVHSLTLQPHNDLA